MTETKEERLNKILDIMDDSGDSKELTPVEEKKLENSIDEKDSLFVQTQIREMVKHGVDAVDELRQIATDTQEPRAFEVLAKLIKDTSDAAKSIIDIQKTKKEIEVLETKKNTIDIPTSGQTNIFVGTMSDILKQIKEEKQNVIEHEPTTTK